MKLLKAYIRHRKYENVCKTLKNAGFFSMTLVECEGTGMYSDHEKEHVSSKYPAIDAYRVVKLEIFLDDKDIVKVVQLIRQSGRTGYRGDGMILVSDVENVYKNRTDEEGLVSI